MSYIVSVIVSLCIQYVSFYICDFEFCKNFVSKKIPFYLPFLTFLGDIRDKLLGLLLEGLLKGSNDKDKEKRDGGRKEPGVVADSPAIARRQGRQKEYSLRELVERQDDSGVRKLLNEKPFMVSDNPITLFI